MITNIDIFPKKVNASIINIVSKIEINMRVFERWAWETLACGTAASASVVAGISSWKLQKDKFIKVNLSWWILNIKWAWNIEDPVIMKWAAETTFTWEYFIN